MTSLKKEWGLELGLVQTIFLPCANVLATYLEGVSPLRRVLDVGCGSGIAGRVIAGRYRSIVHVGGLDWERKAVQVASKQTADDLRFHFWQGDARAFKVDEPYDAVVAQHLLHQLDEGAGEAIRCMGAALRPGGRLIIGQWPDLEQCPAYAFIYRAAGEYAEKAAETVMTRTRLEELIQRVDVLQLVEAVLRTDFHTPSVAPQKLLQQYFEGSKRWLQRDAAMKRSRLESPTLSKLIDIYGRPSPGGVTFGLGMLVVVAESSPMRAASQGRNG